MQSVFFYGLFMDEGLLREKGFNPSAATIASVKGFGLRIGERATLKRSADETAFGVIMDLKNEEIDKLYSGPGVKDYRPETVLAQELDGIERQVVCYNLPIELLAGRNIPYAKSLVKAATKMGLPPIYIQEIESWSK